MNIADYRFVFSVDEALSCKLMGATLGNYLGALAYDEALAREVEYEGKLINQTHFYKEITVVTDPTLMKDFFNITFQPYKPEKEAPLTPDEIELACAAEEAEAAEEAAQAPEDDSEERANAAEELWDDIDQNGGWHIRGDYRTTED